MARPMGSSFRSAKVLSLLSLAFLVHAPSTQAQNASPSASSGTATPPKPKTKPKTKTRPAPAVAPSVSAAGGNEGVVVPVPAQTVAQASPVLPMQMAQAAPPPPPPPPAPPSWTEPASTSLAGTRLVPVVTAPPGALSAAPVTPSIAAPPEDLARRVDALEARLDTANALLKEYEGELHWLRMLKISGYIQPQLLLQFYNTSASPNAVGGVLPSGVSANDVTTQAAPAFNGVGTTTNGDYFRLRRARLKIEFEPVDSARFVFEIDPTSAGGQVGGVGTIAREIEAEGIARWTPHIKTEFGMGIFKIPFGFEVLQNDADRPFIERSWGERNMTPGEFDTGIRAYTTFFDETLTFQAAVINGNMEGEKTFTILPDLNQGKDLVGRLNYNFGPVDVGVSGYYGQGQLVDPSLLAFKQYPRGAGNFEIRVHHAFSKDLGETKFFAEGTITTNMDRGVNYAPGIGLPALPSMVVSQNVTSLHEANVWARIEQDFTHWFTLGLRFDYYSPNDTVCASHPACSSVKSARATYAAVGAVHFTRWLQYMLEYDHSIDNVHAAGAPAPRQLTH